MGSIGTCPGGSDPGAVQRIQGLGEAGVGPVEDVVVGQDATVNASGLKHFNVFGAHPVVDAFGRPGLTTVGHRRLPVDDAGIDPGFIEYYESISPDVLGIHASGYGPMGRSASSTYRMADLAHVSHSPRVARHCQDLVDPTTGHHVAGEEESQELAGHGPGWAVSASWKWRANHRFASVATWSRAPGSSKRWVGTWDDLEAGLASHLSLRLPVEVEHYGVAASDDEECGCHHVGDARSGEVRSTAPRHHRGDVGAQICGGAESSAAPVEAPK